LENVSVIEFRIRSARAHTIFAIAIDKEDSKYYQEMKIEITFERLQNDVLRMNNG